MSKQRKKRNRHRRVNAPGTAPGTLTTSSEHPTSAHVIAWSPEEVQEFDLEKRAELNRLEDRFDVIWVNVTGLGDADLIGKIGRRFKIHNLSLEDVLHVGQRAKFEPFEGYYYFVMRMCYAEPYDSEQLSVFHVGKYVITFQEKQGDCLGPVRERIRSKSGQIRNKASDYLVYSLIDSVIDHYFPVVDSFFDDIETLEQKLIDQNSSLSLAEIHNLRKELLDLRHWLKPHREMIAKLVRNGETPITADTMLYIRDCYDHVIQLTENVDAGLESCSALRDFHFNAVNNRTNEVMKTLTIISTIFIPLGFLAGIYGMNFEYMPGIKANFGFFALLVAMLGIVGALLYWFRQRGWFEKPA